MTFLFFFLGIVLLIAGAELLVRGASRLAGLLGISPLVIGLTVVAFGTSAPELAVSVQSSLAGQADIALGNVVGSNIFNVLFILGISAVITPLVVSWQLVRLDVPIMIAVSLLVLFFGSNHNISRMEGGILFFGIAAYTVFLILQSRKEQKLAQQPVAAHQTARSEESKRKWPLHLGLAILGLGLLILGSRWLVAGAVSMAHALGVSELVIGLTIVAAGTSLPEVATSIIASVRGERDIAVGNVIGSNIFNILAVLGLSSVASTQGIAVSAAALRFDIPVMIGVAIWTLPIFFTGNRIARWEGALFFGYYLAYTAYLLLSSAQHDLLPVFSEVMQLFVIPGTTLTLFILAVRAFSARRKRSPVS